MLEKVISGGQRGGDLAGLIAAKRVGLQTGGTMPKGFRTLNGPMPEYADMYGCVEHPSWTYPPRTKQNVLDADATVRVAWSFTSPGEVLTKRLCDELGKPCYSVQWGRGSEFAPSPATTASWLKDVTVLNVAGNGLNDLTLPAADYLEQVFRILLK